VRILTIEFNYDLRIDNKCNLGTLGIIEEFSRILKKFNVVHYNIVNQDLINRITTIEFFLNNNADYTVNDICDTFQYFSENQYMFIVVTNVTLTPREDKFYITGTNEHGIIKNTTTEKRHRRRKIISIKTLEEL
jgi:hypothetical protein